MTTILQGVCKHGQITLLNAPGDLPEGPVRVIVISTDDQSTPPSRQMTFGKYPGDTSTLDDFQDAEWRGDKEFDPRNGQ